MKKSTWLLALITIVLGGCGSEAPAPFTVVGWGGSSQEAEHRAYYEPFERTAGVKVREDSWHGGVGVIRAAIQSGTSDWDVVQVETEDLILGCEEGLFRRIDWQLIGDQSIFIPGAAHDCGVGAVQWSYLIGYDGDRYAQRAPRSWSDFWNVTAFPGRRGMRRTAKYTLEIALLADGVKPADVYSVLRTREGINRAFRKLDAIRPHIVWWSSIAQVPDLLASGEVVMSVTSPGRLIRANQSDGRNFRVSWDGNIFAIDYWAVVGNSRHTKTAMRFIRFATQPEQQLKMATLIPTGVTTHAAADQMISSLSYMTPSDPDNMKVALPLDADFWVENGDALTQRFNAWLSH